MDAETKQMIEGLVIRSEIAKFDEAIRAIAKDLREEGFEEEDVREYLKEQIDLTVLYEFL